MPNEKRVPYFHDTRLITELENLISELRLVILTSSGSLDLTARVRSCPEAIARLILYQNLRRNVLYPFVCPVCKNAFSTTFYGDKLPYS